MYPYPGCAAAPGRARLYLLAFVVAAAVAGCATQAKPSASASPSTASPADERPNIIFLLADDLRYDFVGYAGNTIVRTPAIDALAARGTRFDSAYVTTAICSVSRASILSGQYGRRHGLWGFGKGFSEAAFAKTYPAQLRAAGYFTGFIGKWGVGPIEPVREGFDFWRGFDGQGTYHHARADGEYVHLTRLIGEQIDTFLAASARAGAGRPWQLSVSFKAPHVQDGGATPAAQFANDPAYDTVFAKADWPKAVAADTAYFAAFPPAHFGEGSEARKRWRTRFASAADRRESITRYARLVYGIDQVVGRLVAELERRGEAGNTVIVFTSDHGFYLGEYGFAGKWYGSEPAIRIPLVVYDPRRAPARNSAYALNVDLAPTMLDLAGVRVPAEMQGRSLVPLLGTDERPADWRGEFAYEHLWPESAYVGYPIPSTEGLVGTGAKYMRYFRGADYDPGRLLFEELYDRRGDGDEVDNRAGGAAAGVEVARYRARTTAVLEGLR